MLGGEHLRGILAAADGVNIEVLRDGFTQADAVNLGGVTAHAGALAQHEGIAVVAVGAQHVRQNQSNVQ